MNNDEIHREAVTIRLLAFDLSNTDGLCGQNVDEKSAIVTDERLRVENAWD